MTSDEPKPLSTEAAFLSWMRVNYRLDAALGQTPEEWEFQDDIVKVAWLDAYRRATDDIANTDGKKTYAELAESANRAYQCTTNPKEVVAFQDILPEYRLKWAALIHHAKTLIDWTDDDRPIEEFEEHVCQYFTDELKKIPKETPHVERGSDPTK